MGARSIKKNIVTLYYSLVSFLSGNRLKSKSSATKIKKLNNSDLKIDSMLSANKVMVNFYDHKQFYFSDISLRNFPFEFLIKSLSAKIEKQRAEQNDHAPEAIRSSNYYVEHYDMNQAIIQIKRICSNIEQFTIFVKIVSEYYTSYLNESTDPKLSVFVRRLKDTLSEDNYFRLHVIEKLRFESFMEELQFFFGEDSELVFGLFNVPFGNLKISFAKSIGEQLLLLHTPLDAQYYYNIAAAGQLKNDFLKLADLEVEDKFHLLNPYNSKGLFFHKAGSLTISLSKPAIITKIDLKIFSANPTLFDFSVTKSIEVEVYDSMNNKWKFAGSFLFDWSKPQPSEYHTIAINILHEISQLRIFSKNCSNPFSIRYFAIYNKK